MQAGMYKNQGLIAPGRHECDESIEEIRHAGSMIEKTGLQNQLQTAMGSIEG